MFRHKKKISKSEEKEQKIEEDKDNDEAIEDKEIEAEEIVVEKKDDMRDLLEKNLKWSQIIYEQNRKINHKLAWAAIAGWLRLLLILVPLVLAIIYLPAVAKKMWDQYSALDSLVQTETTSSSVKNTSGLETLMKILNLSPEQQSQVKNLAK